MKRSEYFLLFILCVLAYFPLFWNLQEWPIQIFDESRTAINSLAMSQNGNYIVTYVNGQPDMWNTKPPLFFWIQSTSIKIFGFNELGLRIPTAIFGMFTCILLLWFSIKHLKNRWIGYLSVMVLVTSQGYIRAHVTRTGDFDSVLIFFTTALILCFYLYLKSEKSKYLMLFFISLTLAGLTKGIAALFFGPVLLAYVFIERKFVKTLTNKYTWIGIGIFVFFVLGYYILREQYNPGYILSAFANEMGGRFTVPQEGNGGDLFYYCNARELFYWMYFFLPAFITPFFIKDKRYTGLVAYLGALSLFYFVIISSAQTKLPWYLGQLYPLLSIVIGIFLYFFIKTIREWERFKTQNVKRVITLLLLLLIFTYPYYEIMKKVNQGEDSERKNPRYEMSYFLKDHVFNKELDLNNFIYLNDRYNPHVDFHITQLNLEGTKISFGQKSNLQKGDNVIIWQDDVLDYVLKHYKTENILQDNSIHLLKIK